MTTPPETVRLNVTIRINVEGPVDTGVPVDEWNAMSPETRSDVANQIWHELTQADDGGVWVLTPGAEGL